MITHHELMAGCRWLARPVLLFYALPWLMALLVVGTIAQSQVGLYQAHQLYFSTWIAWLGPIPLPGAYLVLTLITLSLSAKFLLGSPWRREKLGTTLTHLGVLVLLYGGLATALTQTENFIALTEGQTTQESADYHARVLKIFKDGTLAAQIPYAQLAENKPLANTSLPFTVQPVMLCANCSAERLLKNGEGKRHGMAEKITLIPIPTEKEDELNLSGLMFEVSGTGDTDGLYASLEDVPMIPQFIVNDTSYGIQIGRALSSLPFSITLTDFVKTDYPGTDMAQNYHSDVVVNDNGVEWPARIEMNAPLRYKGYTFYQSSFSLTPQGEQRSILSVVRNEGWLFPYAAGVIIFMGLCVHIFQRLTGKEQRP